MDEAASDSGTKRAKDRVGVVLKEKWRLDKLLGVGGMATVYSATHRNGKRVAIKMMHPELSANPDVKTRFLREGYLANAVDNPGAVSVMDDDASDEGAVFLVMELLEGETLERRWDRKGRKMPAVEVLSIANQLLDVLAAAHAKEIVHRDIKPENVFLTREGQIKVLDFGIARLREISPKGNSTQTGSTMGTPAFMPPEQARGRWDEVDARTDVWAVGATMFALLTGRFVHEADTINEQLLSAMTNPAPPVASLAKDLSPEIAAVIDRALAFKKEDRWPDARAMQVAIRSAYGASVGQQSVSIPAAPRFSSADAGEVPVPSMGASGSNPSFPKPEIVTTARGIASAPSAAPPQATLKSAQAPRRAPFVIGGVAAVLGVGLAIGGFAMRKPTAPAATVTVTAPIPTAVDVAPAIGAAPKLPTPADQVPITDDTIARPPATGSPVIPAVASPTPPPAPNAMPTPTPTPNVAPVPPPAPTFASAPSNPLATRTLTPSAPRSAPPAAAPKHNPLLDRRH